MRKPGFRIWSAGLALVFPLLAQIQVENIIIHGFISQGYVRTDNNNFLTMKTPNGSYEFNEAAINFSSQITDRLRGGLQLLSRDMGRVGNNAFVLDWAYADYRLKDYLGIRLGKIKTPLALYNEIRDVDALRTFILLPQSVYDESVRDFSFAFQGGALYGDIPMGKAGDLEYNIYTGTFNIPDPNTGFWYDAFATLSYGIEDLFMDPSLTFYRTGIANADVTAEYIWGGSCLWNTPLPGLRIGGCYLYGSLLMNADVDAFAERRISSGKTNDLIRTHIFSDVKIRDYYTLSGDYSIRNFVLTGEYHSRIYDTYVEFPDMGISLAQDYRLEGYYGQLTYRFLDRIELGSYYSLYYDKDSQMPGEPDWFYYQKDFCMTVRLDITNHWTLKAEGHMIDGTGLVQFSENPSGRTKDWKLFALKSSFQF
ncbi:hypothetical protein JW948_13660 [bacterium]|nr:hypothetical protein [bacterium]